MKIDEAFNLAGQLWSAGRLAEAEDLCGQILSAAPDEPQVLHLLGLIAHRQGRLDEAVQLIRRAIAQAADVAAYHHNLGLILRDAGRLDASIESLCRAVELDPAYARAFANMSIALRQAGRIDEALVMARRAIELEPFLAEAHDALGCALQQRRHWDAAIAAHGRAVELAPHIAEFHNNLGRALRGQGRIEDAMERFERAAVLNPAMAEAQANLAQTLFDSRRYGAALDAARRAVLIAPGLAEARNTLASALVELGRVDEGLAECRSLIADCPRFIEGYGNLGQYLLAQGQAGEAVQVLRRATALWPGVPRLHSSLLFAMQFDPRTETAALIQQQEAFARACAGAAPVQPHVRPVVGEGRRVRVGYVSPDFCQHVIARFIEPILVHHDREAFEVFCYASVRRPDAVTDRLRGHADAWRDILALEDEQAAQAIRADRVDVLVDLSAHAPGNRLPLFVHRPAAVQVTYLGYPGSTGLPQMDYRISDAHLDPPGEGIQGPERVVRLPDCYWCYQPPASAPEVSAPPCGRNGAVTFASLNFFGKINDSVLSAWRDILLAVHGSRLLLSLHGGERGNPSMCSRLARIGLPMERVELLEWLDYRAFLAMHGRIDIALDPFPYGGGATTMDALWMGVPVVTLEGSRAVSRAGVSILRTIGLEQLISADVQAYVRLAVALAHDRPRLAHLREQMRSRMRGSPLMDAPRFVGNLEKLYRQMLRERCGRV